MSINQETVNLIGRAAAKVGSEYKLAQQLGLTPQTITAWKAGRRTCVPSDRARLAGFAGEDAAQELIRATLEATEGTKRGQQLKQLLGKLTRLTGEGLHTVGGALITVTFGMAITDIPRCILC